jgi:hypothetical protein
MFFLKYSLNFSSNPETPPRPPSVHVFHLWVKDKFFVKKNAIIITDLVFTPLINLSIGIEHKVAQNDTSYQMIDLSCQRNFIGLPKI